MYRCTCLDDIDIQSKLKNEYFETHTCTTVTTWYPVLHTDFVNGTIKRGQDGSPQRTKNLRITIHCTIS